MTDVDLDSSQGEGTEEPQDVETDASSGKTPREVKLEKENYSLRAKLRRAEIGSKYDPEIAALIPEALPADEWDGFAEKLSLLKGGGAAPAPTNQEPAAVKDEPEQEERLAVVPDPQASGTSTVDPYADMSAKELGALATSDPAAFNRAIAAKYGG